MPQGKWDGGDLRAFREMHIKNHQLSRLLIHSLTSLLNGLFYTDTSAMHPYEPVGCFKDKRNPRALPLSIGEYSLNETDLANSFADIIQACASEVYEIGFWYFGVEHRRECWTGVHGDKTYNRHGQSDNCLWSYSVGGYWTIFVYRFVEG